jgi:hypothetical protein
MTQEEFSWAPRKEINMKRTTTPTRIRMAPKRLITILLREINPISRMATTRSRIAILLLALIRNTKSDKIPTTKMTERISKASSKAIIINT